MSCPLRIEYPDAWYHVMNRGRRNEAIFEDKNDYSVFIELLQDAIDIFHIKVAAFCLMQNHYHLLIQTPEQKHTGQAEQILKQRSERKRLARLHRLNINRKSVSQIEWKKAA